MDENKVIQSVLGGDRDSYRLLVERYHVGLIIHCDRLVHDRQTAEDIAQEAFIAAYSKLHRFNFKIMSALIKRKSLIVWRMITTPLAITIKHCTMPMINFIKKLVHSLA